MIVMMIFWFWLGPPKDLTKFLCFLVFDYEYESGLWVQSLGWGGSGAAIEQTPPKHSYGFPPLVVVPNSIFSRSFLRALQIIFPIATCWGMSEFAECMVNFVGFSMLRALHDNR